MYKVYFKNETSRYILNYFENYRKEVLKAVSLNTDYQNIKNTITDGIKQLDLELIKTNEIAKVNKVDPLGITDLRVRGMWAIQHPARVFAHLNLNTSSPFFAHLIMSKRKYDSFPEIDIENLNQIVESNVSVSKLETKIYDPNNPAKNIDALVFSLNR